MARMFPEGSAELTASRCPRAAAQTGPCHAHVTDAWPANCKLEMAVEQTPDATPNSARNTPEMSYTTATMRLPELVVPVSFGHGAASARTNSRCQIPADPPA